MITKEQARIIAQHQLVAPVDITELATQLGLTVYNDFGLPKGISGMIARDQSSESSSGFTISVNANEPYLRRRFTVAHECAHFLLHEARIGDGISDNALYRSDRMNSQEEVEANNTAADLLLPKHLVLAKIADGVSEVLQLAHDFQVSAAAMRVRLRYLYYFA